MNRTARRLSIATVALLVAGALACWFLYVEPARDEASPAAPADVIVALGGVPATAYFAHDLFAAGAARNLVLADPYVNGYSQLGSLCPPVPALPSPGVTCFQPHPSSTRGEAQEISRLASENGWDDVIVVAPTYQISRARYIVRQCYDDRLRMVDFPIRMPAGAWVYEFAYQSAAFVKAAVHSRC